MNFFRALGLAINVFLGWCAFYFAVLFGIAIVTETVMPFWGVAICGVGACVMAIKAFSDKCEELAR